MALAAHLSPVGDLSTVDWGPILAFPLRNRHSFFTQDSGGPAPSFRQLMKDSSFWNASKAVHPGLEHSNPFYNKNHVQVQLHIDLIALIFFKNAIWLTSCLHYVVFALSHKKKRKLECCSHSTNTALLTAELEVMKGVTALYKAGIGWCCVAGTTGSTAACDATWVLAQALAAPLLVQHPANAPGKAVENGPRS